MGTDLSLGALLGIVAPGYFLATVSLRGLEHSSGVYHVSDMFVYSRWPSGRDEIEAPFRVVVGMLNVVGVDTAAPRVISNFIKG